MTRRIFPAFALVLLASAALAQDAELRASSGTISLLPKQTSRFSGSLGATMSRSAGYNATFGGPVADNLWFFAAAQQDAWQWTAPDSGKAFDGKLTASLGDRNTLSAIGSGRDARADLSSSLMSLRFDSVLSSNTFFSANVTRRKGTATSPFAAFIQP